MNIVALYFSKQVKIDIKATQKRLLVITTLKLALKSETTKYSFFVVVVVVFLTPNSEKTDCVYIRTDSVRLLMCHQLKL